MNRRDAIGFMGAAVSVGHAPGNAVAIGKPQATPYYLLAESGSTGDQLRGDDRVIASCLSAIQATPSKQGTMVLAPGSLFLKRPIVLPPGVSILGGGANFSSQLVPMKEFVGRAVLLVDGDGVAGDWAFRNDVSGICINGRLIERQDEFAGIYLHRAYAVSMSDCFLYQIDGVGVEVVDCNCISLDRVSLYGRRRSTGIRITGGNGISIQASDVESFGTAISCGAGAVVSLFAPYIERCPIGISVEGNTHLSCFGGLFLSSADGAVGMHLKGGQGHVSGFVTQTKTGGMSHKVEEADRWRLDIFAR